MAEMCLLRFWYDRLLTIFHDISRIIPIFLEFHSSYNYEDDEEPEGTRRADKFAYFSNSMTFPGIPDACSPCVI